MSEIKNNKKVNEIIEGISSLSLGEVSELVDSIKEKFNIQETAIVQAAAVTQEGEKTEEKGGNVTLHVSEVGAQPIKVYGEVKEVVNSAGGEQINIVKAKQMIDQKKPILENIPKAKAEEYKKRLEDKGAKVEIK
ncbi:1148_t:CDS:1 [Ambispora leptoticha]|uniref:1148_t:CDS:1 n=1 Tax=Ambispora leptoticha TaxID=144679 RepID=A0A9N9IB86_9GLOM|nr:1148_t:CDS:1 [Ambispora leptoticha]